MNLPSGSWLVEVYSDEELRTPLWVSLDRILVPTALDDASEIALGYASALALRFGSDLSLLYIIQDPAGREISQLEAKLTRCFSAVRARHPKARLFLRAGVVCDQVKEVSKLTGAGLVVTSTRYHLRFLSCLTCEEKSGVLTLQGIPCPVLLVNGSIAREGFGTDVRPAPAVNKRQPSGQSDVRSVMPAAQPAPINRRTAWFARGRRARGAHTTTRPSRGRARCHPRASHIFAPVHDRHATI